MREKIHILTRSSERGFTLLESALVVGLTALIAVGIVVGLIEGLDTLHSITDAQSVEFGQQQAMDAFLADAQSATWFYSGTTHDEESGAEVPRETTHPQYLIMGYPGPEGEEIWVRYRARVGEMVYLQDTGGANYLVRTVVTSSGADDGATILTSGVVHLVFDYYDADGEFTDQIPEIRRIKMTVSINLGGATVQREYEATMRNPNYGVRVPPGDFDEVESVFFSKSLPGSGV